MFNAGARGWWTLLEAQGGVGGAGRSGLNGCIGARCGRVGCSGFAADAGSGRVGGPAGWVPRGQVRGASSFLFGVVHVSILTIS